MAPISNKNLKSIATATAQIRGDSSIVSNSTDDDMSDNGKSDVDMEYNNNTEKKNHLSSSSSATGKQQQQKRVTWSGLDNLDYVPTRTGRRKPIRRSIRKRAAVTVKRKAVAVKSSRQRNNKPVDELSASARLRRSHEDLSQEKETTEIRNGEQVTIVQMRTGTLFMYKGPSSRVVFKRRL